MVEGDLSVVWVSVNQAIGAFFVRPFIPVPGDASAIHEQVVIPVSNVMIIGIALREESGGVLVDRQESIQCSPDFGPQVQVQVQGKSLAGE